MLRFESNRGVRFCDGATRRDFLRAGALSAGAVGVSLADLSRMRAAGAGPSQDVNCIILFLVGGPSHLDTFDPKPGAPDNVRGPFRSIRTTVPGVQLCEHLPLMAGMAQRFAIVRSVHHRSAPIHETGHQLMQTGRLFGAGQEQPHYGAVVSQMRGPRKGAPPFVILPGPIDHTGVAISHGQGAGPLGHEHGPLILRGDPNLNIGLRVTDAEGLDPARLHSRHALLEAVDNAQRCFEGSGAAESRANRFNPLFAHQARRAFDIAAESEDVRARYGRNTFGQSCLLARRLVEGGVRLVTVNMFDTVFNRVTWDCHADGGSLASSLDDYRATLCPMFDLAYTALLEDLEQRGLLQNTLVVAMGEFGRTPHQNERGGRDHWPGVWSVLFAGGGVRGGQVIGASDRIGSEPQSRPVSPAEIAASVYRALAIDLNTQIPGPGHWPLAEAKPIEELFRG